MIEMIMYISIISMIIGFFIMMVPMIMQEFAPDVNMSITTKIGLWVFIISLFVAIITAFISSDIYNLAGKTPKL